MLFPARSWMMGRHPEFTDPKVVAQGEGREGKLAQRRHLYRDKGFGWTQSDGVFVYLQ